MFISVVIVTRNRPSQLRDAVKSIVKNTLPHYELIIVDQSDQVNLQINAENVKKYHKVRYFISAHRGKSYGLNEAIAHSKGDVLIFTDDDCIVDKKWLDTYKTIFTKNGKKISAVFGQTLPFKPSNHKGLTCPSVIHKTKNKIIKEPQLHWQSVGFGNNMAIRKLFFQNFGVFKEWLGPGSIGQNAEDAEMILRIFSSGGYVVSTKDAIVYHNRWLNKSEFESQMKIYQTGELYAYGYHSFKGNSLAREVIYKRFQSKFRQMLFSVKSLVRDIMLLIHCFSLFISDSLRNVKK